MNFFKRLFGKKEEVKEVAEEPLAPIRFDRLSGSSPEKKSSPGRAAPTASGNYKCSPALKLIMEARYTDLKVSEREALTRLVTCPIQEASDAIVNFMGQSTLERFIQRLSEFDPVAANYLAEANSAKVKQV